MGPGELLDPDEVNELFQERGWTDGLPVVTPTESRVQSMLDTVDLEFDTVLGVIAERRRQLTAGKAAVNAVIAGCRPAYFPVLLTILRAMLTPQFNLHTVSSSTGGAAPLAVVSGPLAAEIGMNAKGNVFGPGNRANASIGRAVRLVLINVFGAVPGLLDGTTLGHPGKYSYCIAEDDPSGPWPSLREELGYPADWSAVLVFPGEGPRQIANEVAVEADPILRTFAAAISAPSNYMSGHTSDVGGSCLVVIGPEHAESLQDSGWSKDRIREFLFANTFSTRAQLRAAGRVVDTEGDPDERFRSVTSPDHIVLVTAGGYGGRWSAAIPSWGRSATSTASWLPIEESIDPQDLTCGLDGCAVDLGDLPLHDEHRPDMEHTR